MKAASATAERVLDSAIREPMGEARSYAREQQRSINRSLKPEIEERMKAAYAAARDAPGGTGKFNRMKVAVSQHANGAVDAMFDNATSEMLSAVDGLIGALRDRDCRQGRSRAQAD